MTAGVEQQDSARAAFDRIAATVLDDPMVQPGTGFGALPGLRVGGKIFAMLCRGELVVKLAREDVDRLVETGTAERFDARLDGRRMKEWAAVPVTSVDDWPPLVHAALERAAGRAQRPQHRPTGSRLPRLDSNQEPFD